MNRDELIRHTKPVLQWVLTFVAIAGSFVFPKQLYDIFQQDKTKALANIESIRTNNRNHNNQFVDSQKNITDQELDGLKENIVKHSNFRDILFVNKLAEEQKVSKTR